MVEMETGTYILIYFLERTCMCSSPLMLLHVVGPLREGEYGAKERGMGRGGCGIGGFGDVGLCYLAEIDFRLMPPGV